MRIRHAGGRRDRGSDLAAHFHALAVGQADVEDGDVGAQGGDPGQRLGGRARLAGYGDVVLRLEKPGDAAAHDLVIVEQKNTEMVTGPPLGRCRRPR